MQERCNAACLKFDMVWLNRSPIPVGRKEGNFPCSIDFYLSSLHVEEGGSESAPYEGMSRFKIDQGKIDRP